MTPLLDRKAQRNKAHRDEEQKMLNAVLHEDDAISDTIDKWSDHDSFAFRMFSVMRSGPAITQLAIDFSYSKPTIEWLKKSGYKHIIGYVSQRSEKNITRTFCEDCLAAGIKITFVSQDGSQDPLAGYDRGRMRAEQADFMLDRLGYPGWAPCFYAVDFDATSRQLASTIKDWLQGIRDVSLQTRRQYGPYGSFRTMEALTAPWYWQCVAWSAGQVSSKAHMLQYPGRRFYFPAGYSSYDENMLLKPFPKWGDPSPAQPPTPAPADRWGRYSSPMVGGFWVAGSV